MRMAMSQWFVDQDLVVLLVGGALEGWPIPLARAPPAVRSWLGQVGLEMLPLMVLHGVVVQAEQMH